MNLSDRHHDDLTVIKGIGPARQRWFNETLGVRTFQDLAELSANQIESRLKADNQIASRETIEAWIAEARDRAAAAKPTEQPNAGPGRIEAEMPANDEVEESDDDIAGQSAIRKDGWKPLASFVIEFQERPGEDQAIEYRTSVHHMEADTSKEWPGIERDLHCQWMLDQIGDRIGKEPDSEERPLQEATAERLTVATSPVEVRIAQVHAYQPPQADTPVGSGEAGQSFEGYLRGNQPFALEIIFDLEGESAADLTAQQPVYIIRSYVQDQFTGDSTHLSDAEPGNLVKGELRYAAKLPRATLPPGEYRLFAFVNLQAASVRPDFVTFPVVNLTGS